MQVVPKTVEAMDLFELYFDFVGVNEAPDTFHRWSLISVIGAIIARNLYIPFGHNKIYPNQYILFTGSPGTRKGTPIGIVKGLLSSLEYAHLAPNKASKEAFWDWMSRKSSLDIDDEGNMLDWDMDATTPTEAYIAHDEFLDFIGIGDDGLVTNLTNLWDNLDVYDNPKTRGQSVKINQPTINILSGITPHGIADAFRALAVTGGFFSRLLFIYSNPTGRKITFPSQPDESLRTHILNRLVDVSELSGEVILSSQVRSLLDRIYKQAPHFPDPRFQYYAQRRFTHLLKLLIIMAASRGSKEPTEDDCILANTILHVAEINMPKALGEYGKSKHSEISNAIVDHLNSVPMSDFQTIYKLVRRDITKINDVREIIAGLLEADKIQTDKRKGKIVYLANNEVDYAWPEGLVDLSMLRTGEHLDLV